MGRGSGAGVPKARKGMTRMPDLEMVRILSRDPLSFKPYNVEALRGLVKEVRPDASEELLRFVTDSFNEEMKKQFSAFQEWIVAQLEEKDYVEVPDEFIEETEEARRRQGGHIDVHLPERHFTTVVEADGSEKLVFSFKKKGKVASESTRSREGSVVMSFSADHEPELRAPFRVLLRDHSGSKGDKPSRAAEKKKPAAAAVPSGRRGDGGEAPAARMGMTRLPEIEVLNLLARDLRSTEATDGNVEQLRRIAQEEGMQVPEEVLRYVAESVTEEMMEKAIVFQNWICEQFLKKGYVEVPDQFIRDREDVRKRQGQQIDMYLPDRYFTTVVDNNGNEKLVFSFTGREEKAVSGSGSRDDNIFYTYSAALKPEIKATCRERVKVRSSFAEEKKPTAAATSGPGDGKEAPAARERMARMPRLEVLAILSRDPSSIELYNVEAMRRFALEQRPNVPEEVLNMVLPMVVDSFNEETREQFIAFQNWVRGEYEEKGYVEVPEGFIKETQEVRELQGGHIDLYLQDRYFTTVVDDEGNEKLVFSFKKKEKVVSESKSREGNSYMCFSTQIHLELKAVLSKMSPGSGKDEEESDEDEYEEGSDEDGDGEEGDSEED